VEFVPRFVHLESPNQIIMENLKLLNQKDAQNVVHVNVIAPQWQSSYKNARVVVVYGMLGLEQKIHKAIAVADKINTFHFILLFLKINFIFNLFKKKRMVSFNVLI
jgi:dihydroxyacid dehydratase/phosphogluconate dehydratase